MFAYECASCPCDMHASALEGPSCKPCSQQSSAQTRACPAGTYLSARCQRWVCVMSYVDGVGRERPVREERQACKRVPQQRLAGSLAAAGTSVCDLPAHSWARAARRGIA